MSQSPKTRQVLGRGFDSLISKDFDQSLLSSSERVEQVPVENISPNPHQPRKTFDSQAIDELAASIKQYGIIQPLVVMPSKQGSHTLIAGERRWRAAQKAGLKKVPVIIRSSKDLEQLEIALIENVQRVDLNPLEQALSIERLHDQFSLSYDAIAKRLGKANSTVNNVVRLLQLPNKAKNALVEGKITEGHARAILALKGEEERQLYLLDIIIKENWNVRKAERFVVSFKEGVTETHKAKERTATETPMTKKLSKKLDTSVHIRRMAYGGKLEISFNSDEDLDRILDLFKL